MIKKLKPTAIAIAIALIFTLPQATHSMERDNPSESGEQQTRVMTLKEKNIFNIWALTQIQVKDLTKDEAISLPKDVQRAIWNILYELTKNPILEGSLIYKRPSDNQQFTFLIKDLIKEGTLDLSGPDFEGKANDLVMTIDPVRFFQVKGENANKVVILIAPWSLIMEKIESTAAPFSKIMPGWDGKVAPIGIFWRWGNWDNSLWYEYLTSSKIDIINSKNLYELCRYAETIHTNPHTILPITSFANINLFVFYFK